MANKDQFIKHIKAALDEVASAKAALQPMPADGDKPPFTLADQLADYLIDIDYKLSGYVRIAELNDLDMEIGL